ncbi:unnamed protein product [Brassicogethes aeneus]|uniref:Sanpodo n=1 Tax=Brassicogethes aeneus TaxID=1431903 RepID=A0A9P0B0K1_BRAAE|nr:unnamed protein product [Brassicogethes aeneus]
MAETQSCYTNSAFCQNSEFLNGQRALSPGRNIRQPPVGAQTPLRILDTSFSEDKDEEEYEEQEFYEEMLVDDEGVIQGKQLVVVAQNMDGKKYIQVPQKDDNRQGGRYGLPVQNRPQINEAIKIKPKIHQNQRYEYIPMQDHDVKRKAQTQYMTEHRYAVIEAQEETRNGRYALVPVEDLNNVVNVPKRAHRYEYIQESPSKNIVCQNPSRYEYIQNTPTKPIQIQNKNRYDYIQNSPQQRYECISQNEPRQQRVGNPIATQKLHELLTTPKKSQMGSNQSTPQKLLSPHSLRKPMPISPIAKETPHRVLPSCQPPSKSKAQQKLNYALGSRQITPDKRTTAIVPPMCSSPIQSVYSETTYSNKSESWMSSSAKKTAGQATLTIAAVMMLLCGGVTSGLSFYMISIMGRLYYLDVSLVAGFTCLILGLLGFRSRNVYWLPNRNYILGYIFLSLFSLLTCTGLLVLLFLRPRPGSPLADMTSTAICGLSVVSLVLAVGGVVSSYCCAFPPPDNRVQHCVPGFTV